MWICYHPSMVSGTASGPGGAPPSGNGDGEMAAEFIAATLTRTMDGEEDADALELQLRALLAAGRSAWPELTITPERFARHLAACAAEVGTTGDVRDWLSCAHADGLYLACACADGHTRALALFEERLLSHLPAWLGRYALPPSTMAEVRQQIRAKLFVAEAGATPRIADYSGEGPLGAWVRVVAQRTTLSLLRKKSDAPLDDAHAEDAALAEAGDPELDVIRGRYRSEFAAAFKDALGAQSSEARNLLRLHFLDGLSIDKLAVVLQCHRATAARRIQAVRESVFDETRRLLQERLRIPPSDMDSLVRLLQSQLDLSISGALRSRS